MWAGGPGPAGDLDYSEVTQEEDLDGIWTDHFGIKIFHRHCIVQGDNLTAFFRTILMKLLLDSSIPGDHDRPQRWAFSDSESYYILLIIKVKKIEEPGDNSAR